MCMTDMVHTLACPTEKTSDSINILLENGFKIYSADFNKLFSHSDALSWSLQSTMIMKRKFAKKGALQSSWFCSEPHSWTDQAKRWYHLYMTTKLHPCHTIHLTGKKFQRIMQFMTSLCNLLNCSWIRL